MRKKIIKRQETVLYITVSEPRKKVNLLYKSKNIARVPSFFSTW